jgi:hypothetical protein
MSVSSDRVEVRGLGGEYLWHADEATCRDLLRLGMARLIRPRRQSCVRVLQAIVPVRRDEIRMLGRGTALDRTRYSHDHETPENPPRVWTFDKRVLLATA